MSAYCAAIDEEHVMKAAIESLRARRREISAVRARLEEEEEAIRAAIAALDRIAAPVAEPEPPPGSGASGEALKEFHKAVREVMR
jgi:hypothetical protein